MDAVMAFDAQARLVRGEGCGLVLLQPLQAAQTAGDAMLAVLRGSAINQDAARRGADAAQPTARKQPMPRRCAGTKDISYVEAHGSGTPLAIRSGGTAGTDGPQRSGCGWVS